ncbi:MAG: repeat containing protein [Dehalococcoidia bacterium]|nr:repeat containing protein [Dehalococcoidia bacterium]
MKTLSSSIFAYLSTLLVVNIKLVVFALLLTLLAGTGTVATYYATTGKPITSLPGIRALAKGVAPRYLTSVVGPARPVSVALSPDGSRIYVTQTGGSRTTLVYDNLFNPLGELEPPNTTDANRQPLYAAVDRDGLVYVSDVLRGLVDVYNPDNSYKMPLSIGSETIGATSPLAVTFSRDGELMVSEGRPPHRMFTVDKGGGQIKSAWGTTDTSGTAGGEMSYPNGMAEDKKGRYYGASPWEKGRVALVFPEA